MTKRIEYVSIAIIALILAVSMTINAVIGTQFHVTPFTPACDGWRNAGSKKVEPPFHPEFNRAAVDTFQHCIGASFAQKRKDGELHVRRSYVQSRDHLGMYTDEIINVFLFAADRAPWETPHNCHQQLPDLRGQPHSFISCPAMGAMARFGEKIPPK